MSRKKDVDKPSIIEFEKVLVFLIALAGLWIIWPFSTPLVLAAVTAYTFYPLVNYIQRYLKSYNLSILIVIILIFGPIGWAISGFAGGVNTIIMTIYQFAADINTFLLKLNTYVSSLDLEIPGSQSVISTLQSVVSDFVEQVQVSLTSWIKNIPNIIIDFFVYLFATYYFLRDGKRLRELVLKWSRKFEKEERRVIESIVTGLDNSFRVLFVSYIGISTIVGILSAIIYYFVGVPYAGLMAVITWIFAFLPILNTPMIYGGIAAYLFYVGEIQQAIILLILGVVFLSLIPDLLLRPVLCGKA